MTDDRDELVENGQEFAQNMAQVAEISAKIWARLLEGQADKPQADPVDFGPMLGQMASIFGGSGNQDSTTAFWEGQQAIWQNALNSWGNAAPVELPDLPAEGRRFSHSEWSENALFSYIKQSYLHLSKWMQDTVGDAQDLPLAERKKLQLFTRNFVEALNPANFYALNPEVLAATSEQKGENLVRGMTMMLEDLERGKGELLIRQTDLNAFKVGRDMAVTPGKVIWQNNILQLIQYAPSTKTVYSKPLFFIPPWINKYYVLDLNPKKSLMKWLVAQGYTVFIVSWVNPDERHANETWESYMSAVSDAIDVALKETGQKALQLAAYCIGGTMLGTFLAQLEKSDKRVASATFLTTLLDFTDAGELQAMVDEETIKRVDAQMEKGFLPAQTMASAFNMLRSNDLIWSYVVNNYLLGKDPFPFDLLYWNSDSTAMPARVHHFYLTQFYLKNAFVSGDLVIDGNPVSLENIRGPIYQVATQEDHIAPPDSVFKSAKMLTNAKIRFVLAGSGHIAGVVNPPAAEKYHFWAQDGVSGALSDWMDTGEKTDGSWWLDWHQWLRPKAGKKCPARQAGAVNGVLEDAPGAYVSKRFDDA